MADAPDIHESGEKYLSVGIYILTLSDIDDDGTITIAGRTLSASGNGTAQPFVAGKASGSLTITRAGTYHWTFDVINRYGGECGGKWSIAPASPEEPLPEPVPRITSSSECEICTPPHKLTARFCYMVRNPNNLLDWIKIWAFKSIPQSQGEHRIILYTPQIDSEADMAQWADVEVRCGLSNVKFLCGSHSWISMDAVTCIPGKDSGSGMSGSGENGSGSKSSSSSGSGCHDCHCVKVKYRCLLTGVEGEKELCDEDETGSALRVDINCDKPPTPTESSKSGGHGPGPGPGGGSGGGSQPGPGPGGGSGGGSQPGHGSGGGGSGGGSTPGGGSPTSSSKADDSSASASSKSSSKGSSSSSSSSSSPRCPPYYAIRVFYGEKNSDVVYTAIITQNTKLFVPDVGYVLMQFAEDRMSIYQYISDEERIHCLWMCCDVPAEEICVSDDIECPCRQVCCTADERIDILSNIVCERAIVYFPIGRMVDDDGITLDTYGNNGESGARLTLIRDEVTSELTYKYTHEDWFGEVMGLRVNKYKLI